MLAHQVRFPVPSLGVDDRGCVRCVTVDFATVAGGRFVQLVDAKPRSGWQSRDWARGKGALEQMLGLPIEEADC